MRFRPSILCFAAAAALAQQPTPPATPANFYHNYEVSPIGNGEKVLVTLESGGQKTSVIAEPVTPKDGQPVTQYAVYANSGSVTLYSKTTLTLPNPNGGEGTPVEGMTVSRIVGSNPTTPPPAPVGHQSSSKYTTPPRKDPNFRMPFRIDKAGFYQRPRIWLMWDGTKEIQVEPMGINFSDQWWRIPGFGNHIKYLSNLYTEGSPAPRFFYLKRNKDDSMTVYGDDDIEKLKVIEKTSESR